MYLITNKSPKSSNQQARAHTNESIIEAETVSDESRAHFDFFLKPSILKRRSQDKVLALKTIGNTLGIRSVGDQADYLDLAINKMFKAPATVNIYPSRIMDMNSSELKNVWHLGARGDHDFKWNSAEKLQRNVIENAYFQYDKSDNSEFKKHAKIFNTPDKSNRRFHAGSRPIYAALHALQGDLVGGAPEYGDAAFYLRDHIKDYATVTGRDTYLIAKEWVDGKRDLYQQAPQGLGVFDSSGVERSNLYPAIISANKDQLLLLSGLGEIDGRADFIELQVHGRLSIPQDVSHVAMQKRPPKKIKRKIKNKLNTLFESL